MSPGDRFGQCVLRPQSVLLAEQHFGRFNTRCDQSEGVHAESSCGRKSNGFPAQSACDVLDKENPSLFLSASLVAIYLGGVIAITQADSSLVFVLLKYLQVYSEDHDADVFEGPFLIY